MICGKKSPLSLSYGIACKFIYCELLHLHIKMYNMEQKKSAFLWAIHCIEPGIFIVPCGIAKCFTLELLCHDCCAVSKIPIVTLSDLLLILWTFWQNERFLSWVDFCLWFAEVELLVDLIIAFINLNVTSSLITNLRKKKETDSFVLAQLVMMTCDSL
jgi:hypothetical protein